MSVKTSHEMRQRIASRFHSSTTDPGRLVAGIPEYLVLFEVPIEGRKSHEHSRARQRIDAVAFGMWAKTDHLVHGIEIKVTRSDLLRELRDPSKAESSVRACDRWWLALGDPALLKDSDVVPDGWGVLVTHGKGLRVLREAGPQAGERDSRFTAGLLQASMRSSTYRRSQGWVAGYEQARRFYEAQEKRRLDLDAALARLRANS